MSNKLLWIARRDGIGWNSSRTRDAVDLAFTVTKGDPSTGVLASVEVRKTYYDDPKARARMLIGMFFFKDHNTAKAVVNVCLSATLSIGLISTDEAREKFIDLMDSAAEDSNGHGISTWYLRDGKMVSKSTPTMFSPAVTAVPVELDPPSATAAGVTIPSPPPMIVTNVFMEYNAARGVTEITVEGNDGSDPCSEYMEVSDLDLLMGGPTLNSRVIMKYPSAAAVLGAGGVVGVKTTSLSGPMIKMAEDAINHGGHVIDPSGLVISDVKSLAEYLDETKIAVDPAFKAPTPEVDISRLTPNDPTPPGYIWLGKSLVKIGYPE